MHINDPFAGDRAIGNHYFSHGNADQESRPNLIRQLFVLLFVGVLEGNRCADGIGRLWKLGDKRITPDLMRDATVSGNGFSEPAQRILNALRGNGFVRLHEYRRTNYVCI